MWIVNVINEQNSIYTWAMVQLNAPLTLIELYKKNNSRRICYT